MDSRVRGNDGGEAGICRRKSGGGGGDSDLHRNGKNWKIKFSIPANAGISAGDSDLHRNGKSWKLGKRIYHSGERRNLCGRFLFSSECERGGILRKNPVIPAKAGIYSGRLVLEFREFYGKIKFGISVYFFVKNEVNAGFCRQKWIPAFAGMTAGRAGIRRRESDSGGGDSDLHRNGKSWKLGK